MLRSEQEISQSLPSLPAGDTAGPVRYMEVYRHMQERFSGGYAPVYRRARTALDTLKEWLVGHDLQCVVDTLLPGVPEQELQQVAEGYGVPDLPLEYKMLMRLCGGQRTRRMELKHALFGHFTFYDHISAGFLLSPRSQTEQRNRMLASYDSLPLLPIIGGAHLLVVLALDDFTHHATETHVSRGSVLQLMSDHTPVVMGDSALALVERYGGELRANRYDVTHHGICRFPATADVGSNVTTRGVRIRANALFIAQHSNSVEPYYMWAYRIRISMDREEPHSHKCRLVSRYWRMVDAEGHVETVDGPGVIGMYPVAEPGSYFEYASCTTMSTTTGTMEGHFVFEVNDTGETFNAIIDPFPLDTRLHL